MENLSQLPLRALIALARERLGSAASKLKTRQELVAALSGPPETPALPAVELPSATPAADREVITRDFFIRRP